LIQHLVVINKLKGETLKQVQGSIFGETCIQGALLELHEVFQHTLSGERLMKKDKQIRNGVAGYNLLCRVG